MLFGIGCIGIGATIIGRAFGTTIVRCRRGTGRRRLDRCRCRCCNRGRIILRAAARLRENAVADVARPILETHVLDDLDLGRLDVGLLADDLADPRTSVAAAARAQLLGLGDIMLDPLARQVVGEWLAATCLALVLGNRDLVCLGRRRCGSYRLGLIEQFRQDRLRRICLLGAGAEAFVGREPQLLFENRDAQFHHAQRGGFLADHGFERADIVRQFRHLFGSVAHAGDDS